MTEKSGLGSFVAAAERCRVPAVELKEWMFENVAAPPPRWSAWMKGREKIPEKHLVAFLSAKLAEKRSRPSAG